MKEREEGRKEGKEEENPILTVCTGMFSIIYLFHLIFIELFPTYKKKYNQAGTSRDKYKRIQ